MLEIDIRPVSESEWSTLGWLWQCFRHDLALVVGGLPYPDGRYQTRGLPEGPTADVAAYLAWRPHPRTNEPAPVGFAVVDGLAQERRSIAALSATGVPLSTLVRSLLWQNTIPIAVAVVTALASGIGLAALMFRLIGLKFTMDWPATALMAATAGILILLVTALTLPALRSATRLTALRTE